jgi:hypothetical protein
MLRLRKDSEAVTYIYILGYSRNAADYYREYQDIKKTPSTVLEVPKFVAEIRLELMTFRL